MFKSILCLSLLVALCFSYESQYNQNNGYNNNQNNGYGYNQNNGYNNQNNGYGNNQNNGYGNNQNNGYGNNQGNSYNGCYGGMILPANNPMTGECQLSSDCHETCLTTCSMASFELVSSAQCVSRKQKQYNKYNKSTRYQQGHNECHCCCENFPTCNYGSLTFPSAVTSTMGACSGGVAACTGVCDRVCATGANTGQNFCIFQAGRSEFQGTCGCCCEAVAATNTGPQPPVFECEYPKTNAITITCPTAIVITSATFTYNASCCAQFPGNGSPGGYGGAVVGGGTGNQGCPNYANLNTPGVVSTCCDATTCTNVNPATATAYVRSLCGGQTTCTVSIYGIESALPDPCPGTGAGGAIKQLGINYTCL